MARTRSAFRKLAEVRAREAKALLDARLWDGAYYLAGYAIEFALKACIFARIQREGVVFDDRGKGFVAECWTHNLRQLRKQGGLDEVWEADAPKGSNLDLNWETAQGWSEEARYDRNTKADAEALFKAITDPVDGVLPWIKQHW